MHRSGRVPEGPGADKVAAEALGVVAMPADGASGTGFKFVVGRGHADLKSLAAHPQPTITGGELVDVGVRGGNPPAGVDDDDALADHPGSRMQVRGRWSASNS